tara:strand:+ start:12238 stop:13899 length:1662 start_codon:yes stop_codon:yes gene_type:complete
MKNSALFLIGTMTVTSLLNAATLKERNPEVYNYDVLFTNPTCAVHEYPTPLKTQNGRTVKYTKENVFCSGSDRDITASRDGSDTRMGKNESPQHRLLKLINDKATKEIFMTYLSFSDSAVADALCERMQKGMKLELILDKKNEQGSIDRSLSRYINGRLTDENRDEALANREKAIEEASNEVIRLSKIENRTNRQDEKLKDARKDLDRMLTKSEFLGSVLCSSNGTRVDQNYTLKRMEKQRGINWSHTKIFMVNPNDPEKVTLAFSSANMSSGTTIHHENWHFVTAATKSHFVQMHMCLREAEFNHANSRKEFINFIAKCRKSIKLAEEDDIKTYIVPGEGEKAIEMIEGAIRWSKNVDLAAHRFTLKPLVNALSKARKDDTNIRMVFDDDIYLAGERLLPLDDRTKKPMRVPNMGFEYNNIKKVLGKNDATLEKDSGEARYMTTNHFAFTIHHNKYLILDNARKDANKPEMFNKPAVFCGAGNFTKAAFSTSGSATNLENYYYITIPEVVEAFKKQYDYKWNDLATAYEDMIVPDRDMTVSDVKPDRVDSEE